MNYKYASASLFALLFVILGVRLLLSGHAAGPFASVNSDSGSLANGATVQSSPSVSDGKYVVLNNSTSSCVLSQFSATNQPSCLVPFATTSPLNTQIPANPKLATYSTQVINHLITFNWQFQNAGANTFELPASTDSRPTYFGHPGDPSILISSCSSGCISRNGSSFAGTAIHIPLHAIAGTSPDHHLDVIETDTGIEYGFYHAAVDYSTNTMTTETGYEENITTGLGVQTPKSADAAHIALLGGLLRPNELLDATNNKTYIHHALVLDVPCVADGKTTPGIPSSVYPALYSNGSTIPSDACHDSSIGDGPPYGSLLALNMTDQQIAATNSPGWEQTIMKTIAHYGAYVSDTQSTELLSIFRQSCESWASLGVPDIFQNVDQQLAASSGGTYYFSSDCSHFPTSANYGLKSTFAIPVNQLEVIDPCIPKHIC